jgi:hypothetical protein
MYVRSQDIPAAVRIFERAILIAKLQQLSKMNRLVGAIRVVV